jgi:hypothetical protein
VHLGDRCPCCLRLGEECVDVVTGCDDVAEAELAALRWPGWDSRILGEVGARVERENLSAVDDNGSLPACWSPLHPWRVSRAACMDAQL